MRWSAISTFNSCPFKSKLQDEGWVKQEDGEESVAKVFGQAIHKALEEHYKGSAAIAEAFQSVMPNDMSEKKEYSTESGLKVLEAYLDWYKEKDADWRVIATELSGKVETLTGNHELHIDLVAEHIPSSSLYFWDHKTTTKAFSPFYWKKFEIDSQLSRYTKFVKDEFGSCAGAIINGISFGYRSRKYKEEPAGYWSKFERQIFNRTDEQLKMWMESDAQWERLMQFSAENGCYPKAFGSLCGYCQFYPFCLSGCDEGLLQALYQQKPKG
jgi:hypothetical protein